MSRLESTPDLFVLDTLANDIEDLDGILRMLNSDSMLGWSRTWGRPFNRDEVVQALMRMIAEGSVEVYELAPDGKSLLGPRTNVLATGAFENFWFGMTSRGRLRHANWHPALDDA